MRKVALVVLSVTLILFSTSCGSKPAPEEPAKTAPVVETPKIDFETAPKEPEPVEKVEEIKKVDNTVALKNIDDARKLAIDSGIEEFSPEMLKAIDDLYEEIKAKSEEGKDISAESQDLANRYAALILYMKAYEANEEISDTEMVDLVQSLYNEGYDALVAYENLFDDPSSKGSDQLEKATKASTCLNSVLIAIYKQVTKDERTDAFVAKKNADSVKAAVANKAKYTEGVEAFKKGDSLYAMQSLEKAYDYYATAKDIFETLYKDIAEKRAATQKLIDSAKEKVEASEQFALEADVKAPIKGKLNGIEDEDAVLLPEDNYEDPAKSEAQLPEEPEEIRKNIPVEDNAK